MFLIILVFPLVVLEEVSGLQEEEDQWNKDAKVLFFPSKMKRDAIEKGWKSKGLER